jgi:hypothetical protein
MSADNYILIDRNTYKVYTGFASVNYRRLEDLHLEGQGETLDEAIDIAQRLMAEEVIEYGIYFTSKESWEKVDVEDDYWLDE